MQGVKRIKKRAKTNLTIFIFVLLIGLVCVLTLNYFVSEAEQTKQTLAKNIKKTNRQLKILEQNIQKAIDSQDLFKQLMNEDESKALSRKNAVNILTRLRKENMLGTVSLTMTPIEKIKHKAFNRGNTSVIHTTITLKFDGITDKFIFNFIRQITQEFSGYVRIRKFSLKKNSEVNKNVLLELSYGRYPMLVDGMIIFDWFGIKHDKK